VRAGQLALADPALVSFEDLQAIGFGGAKPRADADKQVAEVSAQWLGGQAVAFQNAQ
jgi:hypothetical protein